MSTNHINTRRLFRTLTQLLALAVTLRAFTWPSAGAQAAGPPVKLVLATQFGREVNLTQTNLKAGPALEDICTTASGDTCQPGKASTIAGGFTYPERVAGAPDGNIFVADTRNDRIAGVHGERRIRVDVRQGSRSDGGRQGHLHAGSKNVCTCRRTGGPLGSLTLPKV